MKALSFGLLLATTTLSSAHAQRSPDSLPAVTVDCYQSFAAKAALPELPSKEIVVEGGNFETPLVRYRLQVVGKILKIIKDPSRAAFRTEHGKSVLENEAGFCDQPGETSTVLNKRSSKSNVNSLTIPPESSSRQPTI